MYVMGKYLHTIALGDTACIDVDSPVAKNFDVSFGQIMFMYVFGPRKAQNIPHYFRFILLSLEQNEISIYLQISVHTYCQVQSYFGQGDKCPKCSPLYLGLRIAHWQLHCPGV